jgi:hypothetical protein
MLETKKVEFPGEEFAKRLEKFGVKISEPLSYAYNLPKNMDEQSLQNMVVDYRNSPDRKSFIILSALAKKIKLINPALDSVTIIPGSEFDVINFLHGVASRYTARDIKRFLSVRSLKRDKEKEAVANLWKQQIENYIGHSPGFLLEPSILDKITTKIRELRSSASKNEPEPYVDEMGRVDNTGLLKFMEDRGMFLD